MRPIVIVLLLLLAGSACAGHSYLEDAKERDRLGLTPEEWEICKILDISKGKLKKLLKTGITVQEFADGPWYAMGITEQEWFEFRRKGMLDDQIKATRGKEEKEHSLVLLSFFLPGYGHYKLDQRPLGFVLSGASVACLGMYLVHKKSVDTGAGVIVKRNRPVYLGLILVDCLLSAGDVWRRTRYDNNPDLQRFTLNSSQDGLTVNYSLAF